MSDEEFNEEHPNDCNYTTGLAHLILCGTSGWAMKNTPNDVHPIAFGAFAFLLGHGMLGILRYTHPHANDYVRSIFDCSAFLSKILPLPLFNTELYLEYKQPNEMAYSHTVTTVIPAATNLLLTKNYNDKIKNLLAFSNIGSLGFVGFTNENYWAMGFSTLELFNYFVIDQIVDKFSVPKVDLHTIGLCFFNIFAVNTLANVQQ